MEPGDVVPDFELPDQDGATRRLSDLVAEGPIVLFFYPAAMTYGCTKESCHFRDLTAELGAVGATPVGISVDPVEKQKTFDDTHHLGFTLLSDRDAKVAELMGVRRRFGPVPVRRTTFIIDQDRRVLDRVHSELQMSAHADRALEALRRRRA